MGLSAKEGEIKYMVCLLHNDYIRKLLRGVPEGERAGKS